MSVSACVIAAVGSLGEVYRTPAPHRPPADIFRQVIDVVPLPPVDQEEAPPEAIDEAKPDPTDLQPPELPDHPDVVLRDSFVQQIEPPSPEPFHPSSNLQVIPGVRSGVGRTGTIFNPGDLDQGPRVKFQARPSYPFEARQAGMTGQVLVEFVCDASGNVVNAFAVNSTAREFEGAAVQAVSKWKFHPGRKAGRNVATRMQVTIDFSLNGE